MAWSLAAPPWWIHGAGVPYMTADVLGGELHPAAALAELGLPDRLAAAGKLPACSRQADSGE